MAPPPWPRGLAPDGCDHVLVVVSDVEMGAGGHTDDFPQSAFLGRMLESYNDGPYRRIPVTVVFNGDTFDLLKTSYRDLYPTRVDVDVAVGKMTRVASEHLGFFERVRRFLRHQEAERRVSFLVGNHDFELLFPEVQALVSSLTGPGASFPGHRLQVGDVRIEHGYQADPLFSVDESQPFVEHEGERLLNLPWGAVALLEVAVPLAPLLCALDRIRPREAVLEQLPEVRDLLLNAFWKYWTRDYWRDYFAETDPLKKVSWTMLKEVVTRFGTGYADVSMGDHYQRRMAQNGASNLYLVGHQHDAGWWTRGPRKVLRTGAFRNEFVEREEGNGYRLLPKVYAEVFMRRGRAVRSHLVEVDGPAPPTGYMPSSILEIRPRVRELMEAQQIDVERDRRDQAAQEQVERDANVLPAENGLAFIRTLRHALLGSG